MLVYRISTQTIHDLTTENAAAILAHPTKAENHRPYFTDAQPTPSAGQKVVDAGIVVTAQEARQTWALAFKTAEELELDELETERDQIQTRIDALQAHLAIDNAAFNAMTNAQKIDALRASERDMLRALRFLLRRVKRGVI